jgi:hypothetical protein
MSATSAPFGFRLARQPMVHGVARPFPLLSGYAVTLQPGDAVNLLGTIGTTSNGGTVGLATTDQTRTGTVASGVPVLGIFVGCEYTDSEGRPVKVDTWTASTATKDSANAIAWVIEGDQNEFVVQADGAVGTIEIGGQFDMIGFAAAGTKFSAQMLNTTTGPIADDAQGQFQLLGFHEDAKNSQADTYPLCIVRIASPQLGRAGRTAQNAAGT